VTNKTVALALLASSVWPLAAMATAAATAAGATGIHSRRRSSGTRPARTSTTGRMHAEPRTFTSDHLLSPGGTRLATQKEIPLVEGR
jgi:hypothetical protein